MRCFDSEVISKPTRHLFPPKSTRNALNFNQATDSASRGPGLAPGGGRRLHTLAKRLRAGGEREAVRSTEGADQGHI